MRKIITIIVLTFLIYNFSFAQNTRYIDPVFTDVDTTFNVKYADNLSVLLASIGIPYMPTGSTASCPHLEFDFYEPAGDTATERPLIIYLHTGTFVPIYINGNPTGSRYDYATTNLCNEFAKRGYAVANLEYRLGWNGGTGTLQENSVSLMKAVYRAIQDTKAAVRYFYRDVQDSNNTYRIDTNRIAIVGQGSGGWVGLGYAAIKDTADLQLSKFLDVNGNMLIDLNSIGDWNGYGGDPLINIENNVGYSSDIKMVCSIGGGMGALDWLDAGDVPIAGVHCRTDPFAIYTTGDVSVTTALGLIDITTDISGSYDVVDKSNMLGNNDILSGINDAYTTAAQNASLAIVDSLDMFQQVIGSPVENLFPFNTGNPGESSPWDFWDSATTVNNAALFGYDGQAILANAALTNPDMSIAKSHAYMDSILGFFCPRIVNALLLPGNNVSNCNDIIINDTSDIYVSDIQFQSLSPDYSLISSDTFPQFNNPNCDSIIMSYNKYLFTPNYYTDTITTYDTININIIDTSYVSISVTDTLYIDITLTSIPTLTNTISVYPNPANDHVIINNGNYSTITDYEIKIINSLGQEVFDNLFNVPQFMIPVSTLGAEGTYFIQIFDGNNNLITTKYLILN